MDRLKIHESLCEDLHDLYVRKNADYGDSFRKVREDIPNAILVRLSDKMNRLKTLMTKPKGESPMVTDESIDDTLMDIANYALLEMVERRAELGEDEEVEEKEEETDFKLEPITSIRDMVNRINNGFGSIRRNMWQNSRTKHNEVYTNIDPETGKIVLFQCVVEDGQVIDWSSRTYDRDEEIDLEVDLNCNEEDDDE